MFKALGLFIMCTLFIFAGINWFLRPLIPVVAQIVPPLSMWHAAGAAGCMMLVALVFSGSGK